MSKQHWFEVWMADSLGRTAEECGKPTTDTVQEVSKVCPHCGALKREFTLKHRLSQWGGGRYHEVMFGGGLWKFVTGRAFRVLENAKINNLSELREGINDGRLLKYRGCGRRTVQELSELLLKYEEV